MRRAGLLVASMALAVLLLASGMALALPSATSDNTLMVNGPVRTIEQVGTNLWVGGKFTQVKQRNGTVVDNVSNVAVFDVATGNYVDIAPMLGAGSITSNVRDIDAYGDDVVIGGDFAGPTATQNNLVVFDGSSGELMRWYGSGQLQSVLAAPDLGRIYGGGGSLSAFEFATGERLWTRAQTTVDPTIHANPLSASYMDLERDGSTIWAACVCDAVAAPDGNTNPAKTLVKLSTEGVHDPSWLAQTVPADAFGISVAQTGDELYLAAGGDDFLAEYPKANNGQQTWFRDTSGSAQVVEIMDGQLVVGGHFWEVADEPNDDCGHRPTIPGEDTLDPNDECQTRKGLAAYSLDGVLDPNWDPELSGKYNLAWALHPEATTQGTRLHVGGEFLTVNGATQTYYARLINASAPTPCTVTGTSSAETLTGTAADDVICAGAGDDTLEGLGGNDVLKGEEGRDILKGEAGDDKLYGGIGDDTLDGGIGTDRARFLDSLGGINASLVTNTASGEGSDALVSIEGLTGSTHADELTGSDGNNLLRGDTGADVISGLGGADNLIGNGGDDTLDSRDAVEGNDSVDGNVDTDTCITDATEISILNCEQ